MNSKEYFALGNDTNLIVSNSDLSHINPDEGGSDKRFLIHMADKGTYDRKTQALSTGKLLHYWFQEPDNFKVLSLDKPGNKPGEVVDYLISTHQEDPTFNVLDDANIEQACYIVQYGQSWKGDTRKKRLEESGITPYLYQYLESLNVDFGITSKEREQLENMSVSLMSEPAARHLMELPGINEEILVWTDALTGIRCKGMIDKRIPQEDIFVDLKTTGYAINNFLGHRFATRDDENNLVYDWSSGSFHRYRYYRQMGFYGKGIYEVHKQTLGCKMIIVESKPPYETRVITVHDEWLRFGLEEARNLLHRVSKLNSTRKF